MKIAVLAGNREEFRHRFKEDDERNLEYLYYYISEFNYRGMSFDRVIIIGTFWHRKNAKRIYNDIQLNLINHDIDFLVHEN